MKKNLCFLCLIALCVGLFVGCAVVPAYPEEGMWYCEELAMTLDMKNYTAAYPNDAGQFEEAEVNIDYGGHIFIQRYTDDRRIMEVVLHGDYRYRDDIFIIKDTESNHKYTFVMLMDAA